jgi:hypothetical protein
MAIEKLKINYKAEKIKPGPNHKKSHELGVIRPQTGPKVQNTCI